MMTKTEAAVFEMIEKGLDAPAEETILDEEMVEISTNDSNTMYSKALKSEIDQVAEKCDIEFGEARQQIRALLSGGWIDSTKERIGERTVPILKVNDKGLEVWAKGPSSDPKTPRRAKVSKKDIATTIFCEMEGAPRKDVIKRFVSEAGLTESGASTYYQAIKKQLST